METSSSPPPVWRDIRAEFAHANKPGTIFPGVDATKAQMWKDLEEFTGALYDHRFAAWQKRTGNFEVKKGWTTGMTLDEYWRTHGRGCADCVTEEKPQKPQKLTEKEIKDREETVAHICDVQRVFGNVRTGASMQAHEKFSACIDAIIPDKILRDHEMHVRRVLAQNFTPESLVAKETHLNLHIRPFLRRNRAAIRWIYNDCFHSGRIGGN